MSHLLHQIVATFDVHFLNMAALGVYYLLYSIPILFLTIAPPIILIMYVGCTYICIWRKKGELSLKFAHSVARKIFKMKAGPNDREDKPQTLLFGYVVPHLYIFQIVGFSFMLFCNSLIIFWDTFLIEESYLCNPNVPNLHCYAHSEMNFTEELDCSNTTETIVYCYQIILNFSSAAGSATGVFLISSIVFAINTWLLLYISKGKHGTGKRKCVTICVQLTEFVTFTLLFIFPYILNFGYFKYKHIILSISFFLTLTLSIGMPWRSLYKPEEEQEMSSPNNVQMSSYTATIYNNNNNNNNN